MNVCKEMCATCIFHPGNKMNLNKGRVAGMIRESQQNDSFIVCHVTLGAGSYNEEERYDEEDDYDVCWDIDVTRSQAVCRGYFDRYGGGQLGRISERLEMLNLDFVPEEQDD